MEHSEQALATARELMKLLADDENAEQTLHRIADLACRVVPPARMAGISLLADGRWSTPVCTDPTVAKVDKSQYVADSGPCVDSARASEVRRMDSADSERRWPEFAKAASVAGIKSTISFPLSIDGKTTGALNLYSREENAFTEEQERTGLLFAEQAALACVIADRFSRAQRLAEQLEVALQSRDAIGQAKGIIMARVGCTADEAFEVLRRASQRRNVKLRDIADEVALTGAVPE